MANEGNLLPFDKLTESEQRKIQSAGGKASGIARRRKKSLLEAADLFMSLPVTDRLSKSKIAAAGIGEDDADNQMAVIAGLFTKAIRGEPRAAKLLIELLDDDGISAGLTGEDDALSRSLRELGEELESDE